MKASCPKTSFPTLLQQFFLERLIQQRNASAQTVAAYRDGFRLLLQFAQHHLGKSPGSLALTGLDAPLMLVSSTIWQASDTTRSAVAMPALRRSAPSCISPLSRNLRHCRSSSALSRYR